jgi:hypothetical protein
MMPKAARLQFLHLVAAHQNSGPKDPCAGALPLLAKKQTQRSNKSSHSSREINRTKDSLMIGKYPRRSQQGLLNFQKKGCSNAM